MIQSRRIRFAGHIARMGGKRTAYRILVGKPEEKRPLGRPRRWWLDNTKMDVRELSWGCMNWIDVPQDRGQWTAVLNMVKNLRVP
jgi:hypothetical protein